MEEPTPLPTTLRLWRGNGLGPFQVIGSVLRGFRLHNLDARSAQFAYYALLLLPPSLVVLFWVGVGLPWENLVGQLAEERVVPKRAAELIIRQINGIREASSPPVLGLAVVVGMSAGFKLFFNLGRGLNAAFAVTEGRPAWKVWRNAVGTAVVTFLILLLCLGLLVLGPRFSEAAARANAPTWVILLLAWSVRWIVVVGTMLLLVAFIYWIVPDTDIGWRPLSPGCVFAVAGSVAASFGFGVYASAAGKFNETYGALAAVAILLIWLYLTGCVLLLGAELNAVLLRGRKH